MNNNTTTTSYVSLAVLVSTAAVTAAAATYTLTLRHERQKQRRILQRQNEREKMLKQKTAEARKKKGEPLSGTLIEDVKIDKIFLWECEDLRKKFPSAMVENVMKNRVKPLRIVRSPLLRMTSSAVSDSSTTQQPHQQPNNKDSYSATTTKYNKLITDHECILGDIVRKPNRDQQTIAYMRAGPRKLLHFDPEHVHAAIVTCGGLCPGKLCVYVGYIVYSSSARLTLVLHSIYIYIINIAPRSQQRDS